MRGPIYVILPFLLAATIGCGTGVKGESSNAGAAPPPIAVSGAAAVEKPIRRFLEVTGTLAAQEEAEVAAESQGRVIATPVERGTRVAEGDPLIRISSAEVEAQAAEAEANAAQIEGRLGLADGVGVRGRQGAGGGQRARQPSTGEGDFDARKMLFERKLLSKAEFDQRSAQAEVARRQYDIARNGALQQYQALLAARARVSLAKKALADTVVRAPFAGVVGQRLVSVGDYVTRGTKVASVMRTNPLRVELTVPEQYSAEVAVGRAVSLEVDASPGKTFTGQVRYVSPALQPTRARSSSRPSFRTTPGVSSRARLRPRRIEQASQRPGVLVRQPPCARCPARRVCSCRRRPRRRTHRHHRSAGRRSRRDHQRPQGRRERGHQQRRAARPTAARVTTQR